MDYQDVKRQRIVRGYAAGPTWYLVKLEALLRFGRLLVDIRPELVGGTIPEGKLLFTVDGS